jgi:hypothetical protein
MKQSKRIVLFLLLNIIVSACTILAVLWIWDPANRPASLQPPQPTAVVIPGVDTQDPNATQPPVMPTATEIKEIPKGMIMIENVIGSGSIASEVVILKRKGSGELKLTNWKLQDENGNTYTFPDLTLYEGGGVFIHSTAGVNTVIDLYWNQTEPVWQQGETVTLVDSLGAIQTSYQIP